MRTRTARTTTGARTDDVLGALTDPAACRRWAPVRSGGGLPGRLPAGTTNGLLEAGALSQPVDRLAAIA